MVTGIIIFDMIIFGTINILYKYNIIMVAVENTPIVRVHVIQGQAGDLLVNHRHIRIGKRQKQVSLTCLLLMIYFVTGINILICTYIVPIMNMLVAVGSFIFVLSILILGCGSPS